METKSFSLEDFFYFNCSLYNAHVLTFLFPFDCQKIKKKTIEAGFSYTRQKNLAMYWQLNQNATITIGWV
jgi:hypothetical protein